MASALLYPSTLVNKRLLCPFVTAFRNALYPSWFLTPVADPKEYEDLEKEGKLETMKHIPVKPTPNDMSVSVYQDPVVRKFINIVMMWSEKYRARNLVNETFANIKRIQVKKYHSASEEEKKDIECNPRVIFHQAIENCKPALQLRPMKRGGITYQVPVPITRSRAEWMSMKWLVMAGRDKDGPTSFVEQLTKEILDAYRHEGRVIRRKQDLHRICEANKAYAHYRWLK